VTRVILADDSFIVREGLRELLGMKPAVDVVATCRDLPELLEAVREQKPDVVVTDIRMPPSRSDEGIRAAEALRDSHPEVGIVVLSQYANAGYVLALLRSGSDGRAYLLKERVHDADQLVAAIEAVAAGGSVVDPKLVELLVQARAHANDSPLAALTEQERRVLAQMAEGKSNAAIADSLGLSIRAIEKHTHSIFAKLGLAGSAEISRRVKAVLMFLSGEGQPQG
jgi:DNA-binding NarL/FixJ family response regulator